MSDELKQLIAKNPKQPQDVLRAYLKAKRKLEAQGLPAVPDKGPKRNLKIANFAWSNRLLSGMSEKEIDVYRALLDGMPIQYRSNETIAEQAGVSIATVKRAVRELKKRGLIATQGRMGTSAVTVFTDTEVLQKTGLKDKILNKIKEDRSGSISSDREIKKSKQLLRNCSTNSKRSSKEERGDHPASGGLGVFFSSGGDVADIPVTCLAAETDTAEARGARTQRVSGQDGDNSMPSTESCSSQLQQLAMQGSLADRVAKLNQQSTSSGVLQIQNGEQQQTGLNGVPCSQAQFELAQQRLRITDQHKLEKKPQFEFWMQPLEQQRRCCELPIVQQLQNTIDHELRRGVKGFEVCRTLREMFVSQDPLAEARKVRFDFDKQCVGFSSTLGTEIENNVARSALANLCAARGDHPDQVAAWIKYARQEAKGLKGPGGLLINIVLKAQRINTALMYPDVAVQFTQFLDNQLIGTGSEQELIAMETPGKDINQLNRAAKNARGMLLRDYTGVLGAQMDELQRRGYAVSPDAVGTWLEGMLKQGDRNESEVAEDAPSQVRVACLKYRLKEMANMLMVVSNPVAVYLPHLIHERPRAATMAA